MSHFFNTITKQPDSFVKKLTFTIKYTKRYNVFNNIHKGRGQCFQHADKMANDYFTSPETVPAIANLENVLYYYDEHANHEDNSILSNIFQQEPQMAADLEKDHIVDHELSRKLRKMAESTERSLPG